MFSNRFFSSVQSTKTVTSPYNTRTINPVSPAMRFYLLAGSAGLIIALITLYLSSFWGAMFLSTLNSLFNEALFGGLQRNICGYLLTNIVVITLPVLLTVAFFTLAERQIMASMQKRMGPFFSGLGGVLQPFFDGLKLGVKESVVPELSNTGAFCAAPMISFVLSQISFCGLFISDASFQGLVLMALSSLGVYGIMLSGWASNSKYAFLGCLRSVSLMVSYELGFGAALLSISLFLTDSTGMKSLNFGDASTSIQYALLPLFFIFLVCILAETKRIPFDLPEAEAELVAGYNVEYSSLGFALFFISEYANMAVMSIISSIYFLGGFTPIKLTVTFFGFVWVRATLPRYRYDQFLRLGWKSLLPLSLSLYSIYAVFDFVF